MLGKKRLWLTALAGAVAAFFALRGERLTTVFGGVTAFFGLFSVPEWGVIVGIFLSIASFVLTWYYKEKNHQLLQKKVAGKTLQALVDEDHH